MQQIVRFGISLDRDLLKNFDELCCRRSKPSRSEAIRDLIRQELVKKNWHASSRTSYATLTLVYDHHQSELAQKLTELQHEFHSAIISSMHIHLDENNCLEVMVLKGTNHYLHKLSTQLQAIRGVKHSELSIAASDPCLS